MEKTRITTFGFKRGRPPKVDRLFDVRHIPDEVSEEDHEDELHYAERAATKVKPGESVAVGCASGQYRSVGVARIMKRLLEDKGHDVQLTHRDLQDEFVVHPLLKHRAARDEHMRELKNQGLDEVQATKKVMHTEHDDATDGRNQ